LRLRRHEARHDEADDDADCEREVHAQEDLDGEAREREKDRDRDPSRRLQGSEHSLIVGSSRRELMAAYVIVDIDIADPARYEEYKKLAGPTVGAHGGKYVARGGKVTTLEGDWRPGRIVVLEFPTAEKAKAWWDSPDYRKARSIRHECAKSRMIVVEGA